MSVTVGFACPKRRKIASGNECRGVGVAQCVEGHAGEIEDRAGLAPARRQAAWRCGCAIHLGKQQGARHRLPQAERHAHLQQLAAMLPQHGDGVRREGDGALAASGLRRFEPQALPCLPDRLLYTKGGTVEVYVRQPERQQLTRRGSVARSTMRVMS